MSFDRGGKAVANESKHPFIVEVPVAASGLGVELNRQIVGFHTSRRIPPRFGRAGAFPIWRRRAPSSNSLGERSTKPLALSHAPRRFPPPRFILEIDITRAPARCDHAQQSALNFVSRNSQLPLKRHIANAAAVTQAVTSINEFRPHRQNKRAPTEARAKFGRRSPGRTFTPKSAPDTLSSVGLYG